MTAEDGDKADGGSSRPARLHEPGSPRRLAGVRILYYEPLHEIGGPMTDLVRAAEGAEVTHVWRIDELQAAIRRIDPDALLLEADTDEEAVIGFIRQLRHNRLESDPTIPVFTLRSAVTEEVLHRHADAGVDTVLEKPLSENMIGTHIVQAAGRKRLFVVSRGYVGPERRTVPRPGGRGIVMEVPNRLRMILAGHRAGAAERQAQLQPVAAALALLAAKPSGSGSGGKEPA